MSTAEIIAIVVFLSIVWSGVGFVMGINIFPTRQEEAFFDFFNPRWIYTHIRVNIVGCILLTIFAHILSPIVAIGYWIYKMCTIGRK